MKNIFFSQDPTAKLAQNFYDFAKSRERDYDQDKIIEWIESHDSQLGDKKIWLLTGHAYDMSYSEWEKWLLAEGYQVVIDCRGFGQVLWGEPAFHYKNMKKSLEEKGLAVFNLNRD